MAAVTGEAAGAKGREATLVGQAREGVVLIHELRKLRSPEELLDGCDDRADVDERGRSDGLRLLRRHALANHAVQTRKPGANLILDEFADGANAAVAEVVDVVRLDFDLGAALAAQDLLMSGVKRQKVAQHGRDVRDAELARLVGRVEAELLVELEAADLGGVVALRVEVEVVEKRAPGLGRRRLARAKLAVQVRQGLFLGVHGVLLERLDERGEVAEDFADLRLAHAEGLEEDRHRLLALAVHAHADGVALVDLELEPSPARGNDLDVEHVFVRRFVGEPFEVDARRAHKLRNDDALGAVDDERSTLGHEREVADERGLAFDLAGLVVLEFGCHIQRSGVRQIALAAFGDGVLGILQVRGGKHETHGLGCVFNGGNLFEDLLEAGLGTGVLRGPLLRADEPTEAVGLKAQEIRELKRLVNLGKGNAVNDRLSIACGERIGARSSQRGSFPDVGKAVASGYFQ